MLHPSPGHTLALDITFLRPISALRRTAVTKAPKYTIALVAMDVYSRFIQIRVQNSTSVADTTNSLLEMLPFFGKEHTYKHIVTDRGMSLFSYSPTLLLSYSPKSFYRFFPC